VATLAGRVGITCSVIAGTAAGLLVKYILDQRYIFRFIPRDLTHQGRLFLLYSALGLATTGLFWTTEAAFAWGFRSARMRYLGGALGLLLGYLIKYQLDKRYVFGPKNRSVVLS
jgi:putative flippase GtrA